MKWKLDVPYLTVAEIGHFRLLVDNKQLTFFQMAGCQICDKDIPRMLDQEGQQAKRYCSLGCYEKSEEYDGEEIGEQEDQWLVD